MKFLRPILWSAAILALLLILVVALAFNASIQTWAARKMLAGQPGLKAELGRLSAGLKKTELTDIAISKPGFALKLPSLTIETQLASAASRKVEVKRLVARGWSIDLSAPTQPGPGSLPTHSKDPAGPGAATQTGSPAQPFAFEGILKLLNLPVDFSLEEIDLAGEVTFPTQPGRPVARASVAITGGKLGAGRDGVFKYNSTIVLPDPDAPVRELTVDSLITVRMDTPRSLEKISIVTELKAGGPQFPNGASLHAEIVLARTSAGESYTVTAQTPLNDAWKNLLGLEASFPAGSNTLSGRWRVEVANTDLAPFALALQLPVFAVAGEGSFESDRTFARVHAAGRLDSTLDQLAVFRPELSAIGKTRTQVDFDFTRDGSLLRVERLSAAISGAKTIASVQALQKFDYDVGTLSLKVSDPAAELLRFTLHGLPLAWAKPFLKDIAISGDDVRGEFFASARNGGFAIRPSAPVTIANLGVKLSGQPLVRGLDLSVRVAADSTQQGWQADISEISVRSGPATLLLASLKAGQTAGAGQPVSVAGQLEASLPAVFAQPVATDYKDLLSKGTLKADFSAKLDAAPQVSANLVLADLVSPKVEKLPLLQAGLRFDLQAGGRLAARLPLVLDAAGRKSDVEIAAQITTSPALHIEADVVGNTIYLQDLQSLQALAASLPAGQKPAPASVAPVTTARVEPNVPAKIEADRSPFWSACTGQLKLALKEVVYSPDLKTSVSGLAKIEAGAIVLESFKASFGPESEAVLNGRVTFDGKAAEPYAFDGSAKVTKFDPAPFFRVANPQKEPTVEGIFDIDGHITGVSPNAALLSKKLKADLNLTSRSGVFRGLALPKAFSDRFQGKSGNLLSTVTGAVVSLASGQKNGNTAAAAVEIATLFVAIPYDQLNVRASHEAVSARTTLDDFTLISPTLRLSGSGSILQQEGVPLLKQPLTAQIELGARGHVADLFGKQGMLQASSDSLGYLPLFAPIRLDGTLAEIGTDAFMNLLVQKLLANAASPLGNLFGK